VKKTKGKKPDTGDKPKMPTERITIRTAERLTLHLDHDFERFSSGGLRMGFDPTIISRNGVELGRVGPCMGGGVMVVIGQRQWYVSDKELWLVVAEADER